MEPVVFEGVVEHGRQLGRQLGFPTANLSVAPDTPVSDGVYASWAEADGRRYRAMSNLGRNPSVGGGERRLETHLFGFAGTLYGKTLRVELVRQIRGEQHFASVEELRRQIEKDKETILNLTY